MDFSTQIKNALKEAGLDEGLVDQIKVEKEEDIPESITTLKQSLENLKELSPEDFLIAINKSGLIEPLKKYVESESDRRASKAIETYKKNHEEEKKVPEPKPEPKPDDKTLTPEQKQIKALQESVEKLSGTLVELTQNTSKRDVNSAITEALKEAKLPEGFAEFIKVETVEEVGASVKNLKDKVVAEKQQAIDKQLEDTGGKPSQGKPSASEMDAAIVKSAQAQNVREDGKGLASEQVNKVTLVKE